MKKLIAMAVVAIAGLTAFGGACSPVPNDSAWVYKWKFTGVTTKPAAAKQVATSACSPAAETCAYRVKSSLKLQGYTFMCMPGCGDTFGEVAEVNEVFWTTKPGKYSLYGGLTPEFTHIIGKSKKQVEVCGTAKFKGDNMTYVFTYSGLGKYSPNNSRVTSASGNFAGIAIPCECMKSGVWNCDTLTMYCKENLSTVVYGKWSVKYMSKDSKKYISGHIPTLPRWVEWKNQD